MDWLGKKLGVREYQDWYHTKRSVVSDEWRMLSDLYDGSLYAALTTLYPEYEWLPWRFEKVWRCAAEMLIVNRFQRISGKISTISGGTSIGLLRIYSISKETWKTGIKCPLPMFKSML